MGNHESYNNFEDFIKRFIMPNKETGYNLYYSFDIRNTHFVSLNSEIPFELLFNTEYKLKFKQWLENDLKSSTKRWKIVYLHRPLYVSYNVDFSAKDMIEFYEEIFYNAKIDLVLSGHTHAYERLFPIYNNTIDFDSIKNNTNVYNNPKYPTYLVCGTGGNDERDLNCMNIKYIIIC